MICNHFDKMGVLSIVTGVSSEILFPPYRMYYQSKYDYIHASWGFNSLVRYGSRFYTLGLVVRYDESVRYWTSISGEYPAASIWCRDEWASLFGKILTSAYWTPTVSTDYQERREKALATMEGWSRVWW